MTALAAVFGGLVAGVAGTVSMDTVRYVAYRRAGGRDSPLAWEFPSVDSWEKAPAPGLAGKRLIEGFTGRELSDRWASLTSIVAHWGYGSAWGSLYGVLVGSLRRPDALYGLPFGVAVWASKNDDRVTRVGKVIRRTRLDELPQLWNVMRGDMSVIGPRPERPQFVADLADKIRYYNLRHCVKPGLAGWAQLRYPYGASIEDAEEKLKYDLFYVKNNNLLFDFLILIQTFEVVLFGRGVR